MTDHDELEDVLRRFRPAGPSASMRPPAELFAASTGAGRPAWRTLVAAAAMVTTMAGGGVWWAHHRESPEEHDEVGGEPSPAGAEPAAGAAAADSRVRSSREQPYRVGGHLQEPKRRRTVTPVYSGDPGTGMVAILELLVTPEGKVDNVTVLRGDPPYAGEAAEAVQGWEYEPIRIRGEAIWFVMVVVVWNPLR